MKRLNLGVGVHGAGTYPLLTIDSVHLSKRTTRNCFIHAASDGEEKHLVSKGMARTQNSSH